ncbi:hypothetical protein STEG23_028323 [Scotinomys teguina]
MGEQVGQGQKETGQEGPERDGPGGEKHVMEHRLYLPNTYLCAVNVCKRYLSHSLKTNLLKMISCHSDEEMLRGGCISVVKGSDAMLKSVLQGLGSEDERTTSIYQNRRMMAKESEEHRTNEISEEKGQIIQKEKCPKKKSKLTYWYITNKIFQAESIGWTSREENSGERKAESGVASQIQRKQEVKIPYSLSCTKSHYDFKEEELQPGVINSQTSFIIDLSPSTTLTLQLQRKRCLPQYPLQLKHYWKGALFPM